MTSRSRFVLPAVSVAGLCSCAHEVPFNEADFAHYGGSGSGSVVGQVFRTDIHDDTYIQTHGSNVKLMPANAYTDEIVHRKYANRAHLAKSDPRVQKYIRRTQTDSNGDFAFYHVPPGDYYVACHYKWTYPTTISDADGNIMDTRAAADQWLYNRIHVSNGQTVRVTEWDQGR